MYVHICIRTPDREPADGELTGEGWQTKSWRTETGRTESRRTISRKDIRPRETRSNRQYSEQTFFYLLYLLFYYLSFTITDCTRKKFCTGINLAVPIITSLFSLTLTGINPAVPIIISFFSLTLSVLENKFFCTISLPGFTPQPLIINSLTFHEVTPILISWRWLM